MTIHHGPAATPAATPAVKPAATPPGIPARHPRLTALRGALLALAALSAGLAAPAVAAPAPKITALIADEATGLWIRAEDRSGRVFLRFCATELPARCTPWSAADLGWADRVETDDAFAPAFAPDLFAPKD